MQGVGVGMSMDVQAKRQPAGRQYLVLLTAAFVSFSCADLLGFEQGTLRQDDDPDASGTGSGGSAGATGGVGGRSDSGGMIDVAIDNARPDVGGGGAGGGVLDVAIDNARPDVGGGGAGGGVVDVAIDNARPDVGGGGAGGGVLDAASDRITCTGEQKLCNGACVPKNDPVTGCAQPDCAPCAFDHATAICNTAGQCAFNDCSTGFGNCNNDPKDGCETDLSKAATCGSCTTQCDATAPLCAGSNGSYQCVTGCTAPASTLCGSQCVDVKTNASHCGGCLMACPSKTNADAVCNASMCDFSCHNGYHKCVGAQTCAANTDVNQCGDTCKKCDVPANGTVACTSGDCVVTCKTNYHVCKVNNVDTCLDDSSLSSCGARCTPCESPTDPNAEAECVNKQCGSKCKAGFNLCSGVCSNPSSLDTCGASCTKCVKPPNASTISCNGTNCEVTCNAGYEPSGLQCVPAQNIYVSTSGADANAGTQAAPFRTWKRASQVAQSGTIVNFAAGTYDTAGGDDFTQAIPNGVTLQRNGSGTVNFLGDGQHSLTFAGSGTLQNIVLTSFSSPMTASSGSQTIKGVTVSQPSEPIRVGGSAAMIISDASQISGAPAVNRFLVAVESSAQLTVRDSTITGSWESCLSPTSAGEGINTSGTAVLSLVGVTFAGTMNRSVVSRGLSTVSLTSSRLVSSCYAGIQALENSTVSSSNSVFNRVYGMDSASLTIDGGTVEFANSGGVQLHTTGRVSFRNVRFEGALELFGPATYDFGTAASPGNNTFNPTSRNDGGLTVQDDDLNLADVLVLAVGNKWIPNVQGADANGNMPAQRLCDPVYGNNYSILLPLRPGTSNVTGRERVRDNSLRSPSAAGSCIQF